VNLEDRFEIERRLFDYAYTFDTGDADGWAALFTEDGIWEAVPVAEPDVRTVVLTGREELRAFAERGASMQVLHHQGSVVFDELTAESARTRSMVIVTMQVPEIHAPQVMRHGVYHDDWVKTPDGWRVRHRKFVTWQNRLPGAR
jgi:hypothetical protein